MEATEAGARIQPKNAQIRYKKNLDHRMHLGYAEITVGDWVWPHFLIGKRNDELGVQTEGPFTI